MNGLHGVAHSVVTTRRRIVMHGAHTALAGSGAVPLAACGAQPAAEHSPPLTPARRRLDRIPIRS